MNIPVPVALQEALDLATDLENAVDSGERQIKTYHLDELREILQSLPLDYVPGRNRENVFQLSMISRKEMNQEAAEKAGEVLTNVRMTLERAARLLSRGPTNIDPAIQDTVTAPAAHGDAKSMWLTQPSSIDQCARIDQAFNGNLAWDRKTWESERGYDMTSVIGSLRGEKVDAFVTRELQPQTDKPLAALILNMARDPETPDAVINHLARITQETSYPIRMAVHDQQDYLLKSIGRAGMHWTGMSLNHFRDGKGFNNAYLYSSQP